MVNLAYMKSKVHTMFVSYDGLSDPLGRSQVLPYLVGLSQSGKYNIHVVSCEKSMRGDAFNAVQKICMGSGIQWYPVPYKNKIKGFSHLRTLLSLRRQSKKVLSNNPVQIVHARSLIPAWLTFRFQAKFAFKFIFDMRGFWADERMEGGIWKNNFIGKRLYRYFKGWEKKLVNESDSVVVLTRAAKHILMQDGVDGNKITVIPCSVDMDHFNWNKYKDSRIEQRKELGLSDNEFCIGYTGSIGTWYLLPEMLRWFKFFSRIQPNSVFLMLVPGDHSPILDVARKLNFDITKLILRSASREEMPKFLSAMDMGLFFIRPGFSKKGSSPTKMAEFFAFGLPVVTNGNVGDIQSEFDEYPLGEYCLQFSNESLLDLANRASKWATGSPNADIFKFCKSRYDLSHAIVEYRHIYEALTLKN